MGGASSNGAATQNAIIISDMATVNRTDSPEKGLLIQNIVIRPTQRPMLDAQKWRNALKAAELDMPVMVQLYDLYDDILIDTMLSTLVEKRIMGVTKNELLFVTPDGKEVPAMTQLLNTLAFHELRKEIQNYKFWGRSVIELSKQGGNFSFYCIPRKHINQKIGRITFEQLGQDGIDYRTPPYTNYVVEMGKWNDFGLLLKAAPYVIYKRGGFGDWANYAEIFGMPFREARYDGYNDVVRKQLENALENMGNSGWGVFPKESEITLHEARSPQGSADLFDMLRNACNQELSVLILGQTETTTKTGGKLGGNDSSHEHTEDMINLTDMREELAIMNERVLPILANLGYPVKGGRFIHKVEDEKLTTKDKVDLFVKLKKEYGLPMDDDHIYAETGVPKPANYNQQIAARQQLQQQLQVPPARPGTTPDPEAGWLEKLAGFFGLGHGS